MGKFSDDPLAHALTGFPACFMEPVYVGDPPLATTVPDCATGTASLLKFDDRYFAVTCHHVLQAFRDRAGQRRWFQVGQLPVNPDIQLVDTDEELDVTVIEIRRDQLVENDSAGGLRREKFFGPGRWPPERTTLDDVISFAGFPGVWRAQAGINRLEMFMFSHGATGVHAASGSRIVTQVELEKCEGVRYNEKEVTDLGGMSGGPVFRWRSKSPEPVFAGVIYEYQATYDLLYIRSSEVLRRDGTIDRDIR